MKIRKFFGAVMILGLCCIPITYVYGQPQEQEQVQVELNVEGEETSLLIEEALRFFEGQAIFPYFQEMVNLSNEQYMTQGVAARMICDYFGMSPVRLEEKEKCEDGYIGRLKVEGVWKEFSLEPNQVMTYEDWNKLMTQSEKLQNQQGKSMNEKLQKPQVGFKEITLGKMMKSKSKVIYGSQEYPLYEFSGTSFVRLEDLKQMGFQISKGEEGIQIIFDSSKTQSAADNKNVEGIVKTNPQNVYIGNLKTYSIKNGEDILVPIRSLANLLSIEMNPGVIRLVPIQETSNNHISVSRGLLQNIKDRPIDIAIRSFYWNGKEIQTLEQSFNAVQPGQTIMLAQSYFTLASKNSQYLTTLVDQVTYTGNDGIQVNHQYNRYDEYGQNNNAYYTIYTKNMEQPAIPPQSKELFPATIITGTMKYSTGALKKGEKVEVWAAEKGSFYTVIHDGKKVDVPWNSISIPVNPPVEKNQATQAQLENYINAKGFTSKSDYLVWTDLSRQRTYVFKKEGGKWILHKNMLCSTGNNKTPTPRGEFTLTSYVSAFGMNKGYMCKNAVGIFGDYLYHSVMFDKTGRYQLSGVGKLGNRASAGCIRLSYEDSVWFYKNMPLRTKVWIN